MSDFRTLIERAVQLKGSQEKLAEACKVSQQQISYLLNEAKAISAEMAAKVHEATTGAVSKHDLRPDIFGEAPKRRQPSQREGAAA